MKWLKIGLIIAFITGCTCPQCPECPEVPMAESADIAVINGEDAGTTPWEFDSIVEEGGNTFVLDAASAIHGSGAYKITMAGSDYDCFAVKAIAEQTEVYGRIYFKFIEWNADDDEYVIFIPLKDGSTTAINIRFVYHLASDSFGYILSLGHNAGLATIVDRQGIDVFDVATSFYIDFQYKTGTIGTGGAAFWVNGVSVGSDFTTYDTSSVKPDKIEAGPTAGNEPDAGSIVIIDDFLLSTTGPIGAYSEVAKKNKGYWVIYKG